MMTKTKMHSTKQSDQPAGFRVHPNGAVEVLTKGEVQAIISRVFYEAMVKAGWRIKRLH